MHKLFVVGRVLLPALALASALAHLKWGTSPLGFSGGR